jgi:hypothetical protein
MKHCEGCYSCINPCGREERLFDMSKEAEDLKKVKRFEKHFISMDDDAVVQVDDKYIEHFEGTKEERLKALSEEIHYVMKLLLENEAKKNG